MEMHASWQMMDLLASLPSWLPALPFSLNDGKEHSSPGFLIRPLDYLSWVLKGLGKFQVRKRVCGHLQISFKQTGFFLGNPEETQTKATCTGQPNVSINRGEGRQCLGDVSGMKHHVI